MSSNNNTYSAIINKVSYCGFSAIIDNLVGQKVIFFQKYPPAGGTVPPNLTNITVDEELLKYDTITREEFIDFWSSDIQTQVDGRHKGGAWGLDNCLPWNEEKIGNKKRWLPGKFIRDNINFKIIEINDSYWKVEIDETKDIAYITDMPMPQIAMDVILLIKLNNDYYVKVLTRGSAETVDMQGKITIGAGEHVEKKNGIITIKSANRALEEELGNIKEYKEQLVITKSITKLIGEDNRDFRDPRYSKYSIERGGKIITFGYDRPSSSKIFVCYLEGNVSNIGNGKNTKETVNILEKIKGTNNVEIKGAKIVNLRDILTKYPLEKWGWASHYIFLDYLTKFINSTNVGNIDFKINNIEEINPYTNILLGGYNKKAKKVKKVKKVKKDKKDKKDKKSKKAKK
jgi:hypothetical protein